MKSLFDHLCTAPPSKIPKMETWDRAALFYEHFLAQHGRSWSVLARDVDGFNETLAPIRAGWIAEAQITLMTERLESIASRLNVNLPGLS